VTVRIVIADDQELIRTGFRMILAADPDIEVVAEARTGSEAVQAVRELRPDVVLMDIRMPDLDGIEATRRILAQNGSRTQVVILTTFDLDEYVYDALRAGASGFLLKDVPAPQLITGIHTVSQGQALLAPAITKRLIEEFTTPKRTAAAAQALQALSPREVEVFTLMAMGKNNGEIATELVVAETTVKTHVTRILTKLRLRDRIQAVILAYDLGVASPRAGP
jgi:DNA-binding NarL/FixJ family response regulator